MTAAVLYVQRDCAGGAITALRFFHLRGSASWQAPHAKKAAEDPLSTIAAAADWTVQQLTASPGGLSTQLTVVLDAQGSSCQWLAAPSADEAAIRATVRDALTAGPDDEGGATLSWLADATPGTDTSVQGLSDAAVLTAPATGRQRLALVSVTDLPARVLLDELDKRDLVVRRVSSAWHALALAWDPAAKDATPADQDGDGRVVSASEPVGAAIAIDPDGRLTWSWSQRGTLIAGGTLLLHKAEARVGDEQQPEPKDQPGLRLAGAENPAPDTRPSVSVIEASRSDVGRLASDWLGWSVQLGVAPARIAVIGPDTVTCSGLEFDLPQMMGIAALGAGLGNHWPGASVHATLDDDAVGRTLQRLTDMENGVGLASAPAAAVDPRLSLTELSSRPGAADRRLHLWAGLALLIIALCVGILGWRLGRTVSEIQSQTAAAGTDQAELLKSVATIAPTAAKADDPAMVLKSKRIEMEKVRADQKDEEPILAELQRVLGVLASPDVTDVRLKTLQINSLGIMSRFELSVPIEGDQGPTIKDKLTETASGAPRQIKWDGRHVRTANTERRDWNMAGQFTDAPKGAKPTPPPAPPAKTPASPLLDTGPGAPPSTTPTPDDMAPTAPDNPATQAPDAKPDNPDPKDDPKANPSPSPAPASPAPATPPASPAPATPSPTPPPSPSPVEPKKEGRP